MKWPTVKLGDICRIELGKTPARGQKKYWDESKSSKNIWLSIADLPNGIKSRVSDSKEYISDEGAELCKIVPADTLIVSFKLSLGRLAVTDVDLYTNEAIAALYIQPQANIEQDYLYWYLSFFDWDAAAGSDIKVKGKTLNKAKLKEIEIFLPSISEQKRIVAILDEAFVDIDKASALTEQNLKNARELFDSYLQQVFSQRGEDWEGLSLADCCTTTQGVQIPKSQQINEPRDGYKRYLYISDFDHDKKLKFIKDEHFKKVVSPNDLVVANTGASAGAIFKGIDGILSNNLFKVSFDTEALNKDFLYYFVTSQIFKNHQKGILKGAANPHMGHENFKSTPFSYPERAVQDEIVKRFKELEYFIHRIEEIYQAKLCFLDELKKSLLQKAFSGELTKAKQEAA